MPAILLHRHDYRQHAARPWRIGPFDPGAHPAAAAAADLDRVTAVMILENTQVCRPDLGPWRATVGCGCGLVYFLLLLLMLLLLLEWWRSLAGNTTGRQRCLLLLWLSLFRVWIPHGHRRRLLHDRIRLLLDRHHCTLCRSLKTRCSSHALISTHRRLCLGTRRLNHVHIYVDVVTAMIMIRIIIIIIIIIRSSSFDSIVGNGHTEHKIVHLLSRRSQFVAHGTA